MPLLLFCLCALQLQDIESEGEEDEQGKDTATPTDGTERVMDPDVMAFIDRLNLPGRRGATNACDCTKWRGCEHWFPDPSLKMSLNTGEWQRWGSCVYVCAWEFTHPTIMQQQFGTAYKPKQLPVPPCPRCRSVQRVTPDEWSKGPRRVVDMRCCHYLYSRRYKCSGCPGEHGTRSIKCIHQHLGVCFVLLYMCETCQSVLNGQCGLLLLVLTPVMLLGLQRA